MEVTEFLPICLYMLGIVLLVILIILGIKLINAVDKANKLLDDAYNKTKSLDGIFGVIDKFTDTVSNISDSIVGTITAAVGKVFKKKKNEIEEDDEDE